MVDLDSAALAYRAASGCLPTVDVTLAAFTRYLSDRQIAPDRIEQRSRDLFLVAAIGAGDDEALRVFESEIMEGVRGAIRRYGDDDFCSEVLQRLRIHLLLDADEAAPRIGRYDGRASLRSWVGICAVRMALYTLRGERTQRAVGEEWSATLADLPTGDPALDEVKSRYADAFRNALVVASQKLSKRERAVLRLRFAHGVSVDEIAATYAVHRVTAWRWLSGARDALLEHALAELRLAIPSDDVSLGSLMALVRSRIELSVVGLFGDEEAPLAG